MGATGKSNLDTNKRRKASKQNGSSPHTYLPSRQNRWRSAESRNYVKNTPKQRTAAEEGRRKGKNSGMGWEER
jgi:hypothetical protein